MTDNNGNDEVVEVRPIAGTKYYRYVNDQLVIIRFIKIKNDDCYVVRANKSTTNVKLSKAEFKQYTKLRPDGYVGFSVVELEEGVKDVVVSFYRKSDINSKDQLPFAVCRMNIFDIFTNTINKEEGIMYIGCSVNQNNCPTDMDFRMMVACNGVVSTDMTGVYLEDNLDDILSLINTIPYDDVLYVLEKGYDKTKTQGVCRTLKLLLEQNGFIDDIYYGFNELKVPFLFDKSSDGYVSGNYIRHVEDIIKHAMINPIWVPFDRSIDLAKIEDKYIIIRDKEDRLYIVSYKEGEYVNRPYFESGDTTEFDTLIDMIQNNK